MPVRKEIFVNNDFYHIYNQGVDKQNIFIDDYDLKRFIQGLTEFNNTNVIGSIYENSFKRKDSSQLGNPVSKLVNLACYCLNPNHFHLVLEQVSDNGIREFLKRLGGYARYFNLKYKRRGPLFQGRFKAKPVNSDEYLLHLSAYVNLNDKVHQLGNPVSKLVERSSWKEYTDDRVRGICEKSIILDKFKNKEEYKNYAEGALPDIIEGKDKLKVLVLEDY